jgi:DNA-binding transcriptional LysR family regulator
MSRLVAPTPALSRKAAPALRGTRQRTTAPNGTGLLRAQTAPTPAHAAALIPAPPPASIPPPGGEARGAWQLPALAGVALRTFEIFLAVARTGSMSAAATQLGITQPAVSQAIRGLEEALGQKLFDRSLRPPVLNLLGNTVLQHAAAIAEHAHAVEHAVCSPQDRRLPHLRIGMSNSFAVTLGPLLIERIRHIAASWSIQSGSISTRLEGLIERRVDAVISFDDTPVPSGFLSAQLFSEPFFLALPADFGGDVQSLHALAGQLDMLWHGPTLHMSRQIHVYLEREHVAVPVRYRFDTIDGVIAMVAAGLGWALVTPLSFMKSVNLASRIRCLKLPGKPLRRTMILAMRQEEGEAIAPAIRQATGELLRDVFLPEARRLLPDIAGQIVIGAAPAKRKTKIRGKH